MVYDKDYEQQGKELGLTPDSRTANVMVDLANSIHKDIQMVGDTPSDHNDGRVPMLDLAFFMEDVEEETVYAGKTLTVKYRKIC